MTFADTHSLAQTYRRASTTGVLGASNALGSADQPSRATRSPAS